MRIVLSVFLLLATACDSGSDTPIDDSSDSSSSPNGNDPSEGAADDGGGTVPGSDASGNVDGGADAAQGGGDASAPDSDGSAGDEEEPQTDDALCRGTGGDWDDGACNHYICGEPRDCRALIPGCDCGATANFRSGQGCVEDPACQRDSKEARLCAETEGRWVPDSCGNFVCGQFPDCDAVIPGCDCGHGRNFVSDVGCSYDATCEQSLCEGTGGTWDEGSCGHWVCGEPPLCLAIIPGCDCGVGRTYDDGSGCESDPGC